MSTQLPQYSSPERHGQMDALQGVRSASSRPPSSILSDKQATTLKEYNQIPKLDNDTMPSSSAENGKIAPTLERNPVARARAWFMPYAAEFLGVMVFVMFGCGANCQVNLTRNPSTSPGFQAGSWTSLSLGWGAGLAVAVWVSGGHVNPAVTLAMAVFRGFPWRQVPGFWLSQLLGGICGAGIVYGNYLRAIDINEGGTGIRTLSTAGYFGTIPVSYLSNAECFVSELIGTALLVLSLFALLDKSKNNWHSAAVGVQTSFAYNPARDLGPRMFTAMLGYGRQVFTFRSWYWLYAPIIGDFLGGLIGAGLYDIFLYKEKSNVVSKLLQWRDRRRTRALSNGGNQTTESV
ncbi:hypothetical protein H1R20_g11332, partial [Candolleomyces eurysporus]